MGNGFWIAVGQMCQLCFWTVRYFPKGSWRKLPRRTLTFGLAIPVLLFFQLIHWFGFALDEVIFRRYRKVAVTKPIFISGIPRSGTTHLQRVLADHDKLTAMQTWECVLAPSITEKNFYRFVGKLLKPVAQWIGRLPVGFLQQMDSIHKLGLNEAEEDFIALLPINACFLLVVFFPSVDHYWRLSEFDSKLSRSQRKQTLKFYHRIIQKHLFFHGSHFRYISKNPSFMTWSNSLVEQYPDCSLILCERPAEKTVQSQLSSLTPTWQLIYGEAMPDSFKNRIVGMLAYYYQYLSSLDLKACNAKRLPMTQLVGDLRGSIELVLEHCELPATEVFSKAIEVHIAAAGEYKSTHHYGGDFNREWQRYSALFSPVSESASSN